LKAASFRCAADPTILGSYRSASVTGVTHPFPLVGAAAVGEASRETCGRIDEASSPLSISPPASKLAPRIAAYFRTTGRRFPAKVICFCLRATIISNLDDATSYHVNMQPR
jgi:hypothetical protein